MTAMRNPRWVVAACLAVGLCASGAAETRPRLFVKAKKAEALRRLVAQDGHHGRAFAELKARLEKGPGAYHGRPGYQKSAMVREAAMVYVITEDARYARLAFDTLMASREDEDKPETGYGLSRSMMQVAYAIAYDWCHKAWSAEQRKQVLSIMKTAADAWPAFRHANVEANHKGSNWVGVVRGGELLLHLSARNEGDYGNREDRIALCISDLSQHMKTAYGKSGWTQEGLGYLQYTFTFLAPAVYAARDSGMPELFEQFRAIEWHRLVMTGMSFRERQNMLQSGVDNESVMTEGLASLIFPTVPAENLGHYRFWYDRHLGMKAIRPTFDGQRAGALWALLYYPEGAEVKDPNGAVPHNVFDDAKGAYYFRSRWRDKDDVLVSMMTRNDHHGNAWSQTETLQLAMMAFDTTFAAGPGKERAPELYSKLMVDGKVERTAGRARTLETRSWPDGSGYVAVDAAESFGLKTAERRLRVDYSGASGQTAVVAVLDRLEDERPHTYTFQLRPGAGVAISAAEESGVPVFLMRKGDAFLKGWVLSPGAVRVSVEGPLRVEAVEAQAAEFFVVMAIGRGVPPAGVLQADGVRIGGTSYSNAWMRRTGKH